MVDVEQPGVETMMVEVAYALPTRQRTIALQVKPGTTAREAVEMSGILNEFPEIDLSTAEMGVFAAALDGKTLPQPDQYQVRARDRVEIYRPLLADPKAARAQRAARAKQNRSN